MTASAKPPSFPFEQYLSHQSLRHIPDYDYEWDIIILKMILATIIFINAMKPSYFKKIFTNKKNDNATLPTNTTRSITLNEQIKMDAKSHDCEKTSNDNNETKENDKGYASTLLLYTLIFVIGYISDYDYEWDVIILKMILATIIFIVAMKPSFFKKIFTNEKNDKSNSSLPTNTSIALNEQIKMDAKSQYCKQNTNDNNETKEKDKGYVSTLFSTFTSIIGSTLLSLIIFMIYLSILFILIATSPNNIRTSRHVYQSPLLTKSECQSIIDMANRAAEHNTLRARTVLQSIQTKINNLNHDDNNEFPTASTESNNENKNKRNKLKKALFRVSRTEKELLKAIKIDNLESKKARITKILSKPSGWRKDRHTFYPSTDLGVVIDFAKEDQLQLAKLLHSRLSPILCKLYGITPDSIRANDMFIVRYDGHFGQQALESHFDSSHVSFNILLNDDFEGGGTRYHDTNKGTYYDAKPNVGDVLINNAMVKHEGLATTKGTRYILVGFMNVDHIDPWTGVPTTVPLHSTYLSFQWLVVNLNSHFRNIDENENSGDIRSRTDLSSQKRSFAKKVDELAPIVGDYFAPHGLIELIHLNEKKLEYITALDEYNEEYGQYTNKAKWFEGQQIEVNFFGKYIGEVSAFIINDEAKPCHTVVYKCPQKGFFFFMIIYFLIMICVS